VQDLVVAFGLFLVLEGLVYAGFPGAVKRMARQLPLMPDSTLRNFGVIAMLIGVVVVWLARG
jgi:uncharacterized protein YjeT (DUF2065 family)